MALLGRILYRIPNRICNFAKNKERGSYIACSIISAKRFFRRNWPLLATRPPWWGLSTQFFGYFAPLMGPLHHRLRLGAIIGGFGIPSPTKRSVVLGAPRCNCRNISEFRGFRFSSNFPFWLASAFLWRGGIVFSPFCLASER